VPAVNALIASASPRSVDGTSCLDAALDPSFLTHSSACSRRTALEPTHSRPKLTKRLDDSRSDSPTPKTAAMTA